MIANMAGSNENIVVEVPAHLKPVAEAETVTEIQTGKAMVSDEAAELAAIELGYPTLDRAHIKALRDLGVYLDSMGLLQMSHARSIVTQADIKQFIVELRDVVENAGDDQVRVSAATAASSLFGKMIEAEKHIASLHAIKFPEGVAGKKKNRSFAPGQVAPMTLAVQINNGKPS